MTDDKTELTLGQPAPDFTLENEQGQPTALSSLRGKKIALYFYPKDDTSGCTKEACSFKDHSADFKKLGALVIGVSLDDAKSHQKFIKKYGLNFPLLCDEDAKVSRLYDVYKKKSMYGNQYWGIERSTFVIDSKGNLAKIFRKVKVDGHTEEVLEALKEIS